MFRKKVLLLSVMAMLLFSLGCLICGCEDANDSNSIKQELELTVTQLELSVGDRGEVSVKQPQEGVTYSYKATSDAVTVDEHGMVIAEKIGSAAIVVSTSEARGVCLVVVKDTKPVELNGLTIENEKSTISVGETLALSCKKDPIDADNYNSIQWLSDNEYVASVDTNGVLTANKPGNATITVKATGTDKTAQISLSVLARKSVLELNYTDVTGVLGNNDLTLTTSLFTDYDDVVKEGYKSSDPTVATVNEQGEVTFLKAGKTVISYALTCGGSDHLQASCKVAVVEKEGYTVIRTPKQLQDIGNTSGNYMLGNDIDLSEACSEGGELYHAGQGFTPLFNEKASAFSGTFDGMGYSIKNLMMKRSNSPFVALFSYINVNKGSEGVICNLALEGGKIEGGNYCASFVASCNGSGSAAAGLRNCWTDIELVSWGQSCGGLIANNGGLIENCYSLSKISGSGTLSSVSHNTLANNSEIGVTNTYICKDNQPNVTQPVNTGKINDTIVDVEYKTLAEMKTASLYEGWDTDVWNIEDGSLPTLKTENDK